MLRLEFLEMDALLMVSTERTKSKGKGSGYAGLGCAAAADRLLKMRHATLSCGFACDYE